MVSDRDIVKVLTESLEECGQLTLPRDGNSMGRKFSQADALVIRKLDGKTPEWGSVLVFRQDDRLLAHRVIWRFPKGAVYAYITKGDARATCDLPFVAEADVVGEVVALKRGERVISLRPSRFRAGWGLVRAFISAGMRRVKRK